ncbi:MAG: hypothetical protein CVU11_12560 [Bacteroidetes bacterium HGW-Bacteroidetes-6]|jgi:hypothetical protein|nr:MAG: hypothetical protein CVU11_12560 [Bacteroidetes bacterium HGW-Bacteroidetes-6]
MKALKIFSIVVLTTAVIATGCRKDDFDETVGVCPTVIATTPSDGATSVPLTQTISVTFNEKMNAASITPSSFIVKGANVVSGTITYNDSTATFNPDNDLEVNTTYSGCITTNVCDENGNKIQANYVWTFSTGTTLAPLIIDTDPLDNATDVFLNKTVIATFSMPMNPASFNGTNFSLMEGINPVSGTVSCSGAIAIFNPTNNLTANTDYTATITTGVENTSGFSIPANYSWSFTTGTQIAPSVISTDPANNETNVPLNQIITADFSEIMNASTITNASFKLTDGNNNVTGLVSYLGTTATFTPTNWLLSGTTYTGTITTIAENLTGITLVNEYIWTFSTVSTGGPNLPVLNSVKEFGIIAGVGVSNDAGFSIINDMNIGISPGVRSSIIGFPPAVVVNGAIYASDDISPPGIAAMLILAKQDLVDAYLFAESAISPAPIIVSGDIGGMTLAPGIYKSNSTLLIQSGDLTLDAQGDANAGWIFQVASDFTTVGGAGGNIILAGGAQADNIYWQVGSSATIGDYTSFKGNILALTSITMNVGAVAEGRMLARNGSVVMTSTNIINKP